MTSIDMTARGDGRRDERACEAFVILVAHGAREAPSAGAAVRRLAAMMRDGVRRPIVEIAYLHAEPELASVLAALAPSGALRVVPLFAADGAHARVAVDAAIATARRAHPRAEIRRTGALGRHPAYADALARRVRRLVPGRDIDPARTDFIALGHGSRRAAAPPDDAARRLADSVTDVFATSRALYLDGKPAATDWPACTRARDVVVAPVFFSDANHASVDVPALFGRPASIPAVADRLDGPWPCEGRRIWLAQLPLATPDVATLVLAIALGDAVGRDGCVPA